jgi:heme/copper-type cytochrome/quinol oxidase subunit 2
MDTQHLSAADGFVLAMIAMMVISAGVIALLIFCGLRNAARRDQQVDDLLDEVNEEEERKKTAPAKADAPKPEPWEKDGDWWKK